jgi:hypothetical protein
VLGVGGAGTPRLRRWWPAALALVVLLGATCSNPPPPPPPPPPPASALVQAACDGRLAGAVAGQVASNALTETSGIAASRANNGVVWAHNDSGDTARVFAMTTSGQHLGSFTLGGATAVDWEDMAIGPGPQAGQSYLYVGDIGDNNGVRSSIVVYRVAEPSVNVQQPPGDGQVLTDVSAITLQYPDGARDAEALAVDPATGEIVIVTKKFSGQADVYTRSASEGSGTLAKQAPVPPGFGTLVTGASVPPDGNAVVLRTYSSVLLFPRPTGGQLHDALGETPCTGASASEPQGEAVTVTPNGLGYVTISEGANPPVNQFDVT